MSYMVVNITFLVLQLAIACRHFTLVVIFSILFALCTHRTVDAKCYRQSFDILQSCHCRETLHIQYLAQKMQSVYYLHVERIYTVHVIHRVDSSPPVALCYSGTLFVIVYPSATLNQNTPCVNNQYGLLIFL